MKTITITKDFGIGKANTELKAHIQNIIINALVAEFGEENVSMVRVPKSNPSSEVNEIGVRAQIVEKDGFPFEHCATINPTIKNIEEKVTKSYTIEPFDFEGARDNYNSYIEQTEQKKRENAENKAKKIAKSKADREAKKKANEERIKVEN